MSTGSDAVPDKLVLRCTRGSGAGTEIAVALGAAVVGRADDCDVKVNPYTDVKVSSHHARFQGGPSGWTFTDLGSTNGSLVNSRPAQPNVPVPLREGMVIDLGEDQGPGTVSYTVVAAGVPGAAASFVSVTCSSCGTHFPAQRALLGRSTRCPTCGAPVEVPITTKLFGAADAAPMAPLAPRPTSIPAGPPRYPISGSGAAPLPAYPMSPGPSPGVSAQPEGLLGRMHKRVKNFRERREVQDEIALCTQQMGTLGTRCDSELAALGRAGWAANPDLAAGLPGGTRIAERSAEIDRMRQQLDESMQRMSTVSSEVDGAIQRWQSALDGAVTVRSARERERAAAGAAHAEAVTRLRRALDECLQDIVGLASRAAAIRDADPERSDPAKSLAELIVALRAHADGVAARSEQVVEPHRVAVAAIAAFRQATELHTEAQSACAYIESKRETELAELRGRLGACERDAQRLRASVEQALRALSPAFGELGRAIVERQGGNLVDPESAELRQASEAWAQQVQLQHRLESLQNRLREL